MNVYDHKVELLATFLFFLACVHIFFTKEIRKWSEQCPPESFLESLFQLLSEIEIVFGFWAILFYLILALMSGPQTSLAYLDKVSFNEAIFVFSILIMASTKPIIFCLRESVVFISRGIRKLLHTDEMLTEYFIILTLGPLLAGLITQTAAMAITAILLNATIRDAKPRLVYTVLGVLFVNIAAGASVIPYFSNFFSPGIEKFSWTFLYLFNHFGLKALVIIFLNASLFVYFFRNDILDNCIPIKEIEETRDGRIEKKEKESWPISILFLFLFLGVIGLSFHMKASLGIFFLFLGLTTVLQNHVGSLKFRESLMVSFFLAGFSIFSSLQSWWISPFLMDLQGAEVYLGSFSVSLVLGKVTIFLETLSQGPFLAKEYQYLISASIAAAGLTLISNFSNIAGLTLMNSKFKEGFSSYSLLKYALWPSIISFIIFGLVL